MTTNTDNNTMLFGNYDIARAAFAALGVKLPRKVADWKQTMYLAHPDLSLCEANSLKFQTWMLNSRNRVYRFTAYDAERRQKWVELFARKGVRGFTF